MPVSIITSCYITRMLTRYRSAASVVLGTLALLTAGLAASRQKPTAAANSSKQSAKPPAVRKIPCKIPENTSSCYWTRGRLSIYEGGAPSYRLWKIGTRRMLGIFNGPSHFPPSIDEYDKIPELPTNLLRAYEADIRRMKKATGITWTIPPPVFADFEICPLEPEKKDTMQAVCIESAKNIFVEQDD